MPSFALLIDFSDLLGCGLTDEDIGDIVTCLNDAGRADITSV